VGKEVPRKREKGFCTEVRHTMIFDVEVTGVCFLKHMCICANGYLGECVFVCMCICVYVDLCVCVFVRRCRDPIPSVIAESDIRAC